MAQPDVEAGLTSLRQSLRRIKTLLAWQQLQQAEAEPHTPPSFALKDSVERDLGNEYAFFLSTSMQIYSLLNNTGLSNLSKEKCQYFKKQLLKLENQLHRAQPAVRLYPARTNQLPQK
jgi:hypothetical protein